LLASKGKTLTAFPLSIEKGKKEKTRVVKEQTGKKEGTEGEKRVLSLVRTR